MDPALVLSRLAAAERIVSAMETMGASLTVAVLCRADEPALDRTLASLARAADALTSERAIQVRYVLCINGSDVGEALAQAKAFAGARGQGRTLVLTDPRADKARAWNLVRERSETDRIAFCDADVEVDPDALVALVDALAARPEVALVSARQVPRLDGEASLVARAAALPYRFDFGTVGGRLYLMRSAALQRMPEGLLLEDGWLSAHLGREAVCTEPRAQVGFRPPRTLPDYLRERLRTEAGKRQVHGERSREGKPAEPIARYPWQEMAAMPPADWPLAALNLGVRFFARALVQAAVLTGRDVRWAPVRTSKPPALGEGRP